MSSEATADVDGSTRPSLSLPAGEEMEENGKKYPPAR